MGLMGTKVMFRGMKMRFSILVIASFLSILSSNTEASRKLGMTNLVIYEYENGTYRVKAVHVAKARDGKEYLNFKVCGKEYGVEGGNGGKWLELEKCDLVQGETYVELYYVDSISNTKTYYERFYPESCAFKKDYYNIEYDESGVLDFYMASNQKEYITISNSEGFVLDKFKIRLGCDYSNSFIGIKKGSSIFVNGKKLTIK